MWPQALQMTRDECRGILRRLELESYSQVISVFRAQGGLSDAKAKLLEELRGIFHISSERHRAEARRVANDEQLATIAEAISGPNTWQEWSREGRRPYPMLPRVAPQTALALISNNIAEETATGNAKLPFPAETSEAVKEDQYHHQLDKQRANDLAETINYNVVTSDPFKVPKIPASTKKNLKRNINEQQQASSGASNKKRATSDNSPQKNNHHHHPHHNAHKQHYPHITANSPQSVSGVTVSLGQTDRKQQQQQTAAQQQHLQKQRFFHHQQQLTKQKMAKKAAAAAASGHGTNSTATNKRQATPAKSGRRANQKMLSEQKLALKQMQISDQQHQQQQQQQQHPSTNAATHIDLNLQHQQLQQSQTAPAVAGGGHVTLTQQQLDLQFVSYAIQQNQPPQQIFMDDQQTLALSTNMTQTQSQNVHLPLSPLTGNNSAAAPTVYIPPSLITSLASPSSATTSLSSASSTSQATSKRDVSKNLNKLQLQQQNQFLSSAVQNPNSPSVVPTAHDFPTPSVGSIISTTPSASIVPVGKTTEKSLISTTPVQKYIVEERQPTGVNIPTSLGSIVNLQNSLSSNVTSIVQVQVSSASNTQQQQPQIMNLPQFSAAATKLRAVNTTLIAPGSKMSPNISASCKKITTSHPSSAINAGALHELANVASTQSQVLHIVEQSPAGNNNNNNATPSPSFNPPLHTPPAVIRLQSNQQVASSPEISVSCTQGSVLGTKILPLVLTAGMSSCQTSSSTTSSSMAIAGSSTPSTVATSLSANIIKNLPSTVVLNTSTSNLTPVTVTGTIFSTLGAGATVFRKPPNIIKTNTPVTVNCSISTSSKSLTPTSSSCVVSTAGPHIISNVKLTPVNVTSTSVSPLSSTSTFKNVLPPNAGGVMRTSVKICQSPNGKVVIQPAGLMDSSKIKTLPHKIFTNTSAASAVTGSSTMGVSSGSGQRIAIQKVQIIPAPLGSPSAGANVIQTAGNMKTSPLAGKSNMIFMPTSATTNVRPVTLSKMGNNILLKSTAATNAQLSSSNSDSLATAKTNIVVIGPSTPTKDTPLNHHQKIETSSSSLMAEDNTPLDILNMPIVMEPGVGVVSSVGSETVTVLSSSGIIESNSNNTASAAATPITIIEQDTTGTGANTSQPTVILGATDWEMELDQAITTAAANNSSSGVGVHHTQQKTSSTSLSHNKQKRTISASSSSTSNSSTTPGNGGGGVAGGNKHKRLHNELISVEIKPKASASSLNSLNSIIVVDSFDDVIVEEHEDEEHSQISTTAETKNNEDLPKILDMQIYQQHDNVIGGGHKSKISIVGNQQSSSLKTALVSPVSMSQQQQNATETEVDAGFDETIVTEIDENTAIEYIEEDGVVNVTTEGTIPAATATITAVISNNLDHDDPKIDQFKEDKAKGEDHFNIVNPKSENIEGELKNENAKKFNDRSSINHSEIITKRSVKVQDNLGSQHTLDTIASNNSESAEEQVEL